MDLQPRVAIVGSGWGVRVQLGCFEKAGCEVVAIWVRTNEKIAEIRKTIPESRVPVVTADFEAILQDESIELVSIVTPPGAHMDMSVRALQSGKHVLCDKPTALNAEEARRMAEAARARPQQLSLIDHELRFLSNYRQMRHLVVTGEHLGTLRRLEVFVQYSFPKTQKWNWWQSKEAGGGGLGAIGSHYIDLLCFLAGSRIESVFGTVQTIIPTLPDAINGEETIVTADHFSSFNFTMANGATGTVHLSFAPHLPPNHRVILHGTTGTAIMEQSDLTVFSDTGVVMKETETVETDPAIANLWATATFRYFARLTNALKIIKQGSSGYKVSANNDLLSEAASFEDGLHTQLVLDAIRLSSESGKMIHIINE